MVCTMFFSCYSRVFDYEVLAVSGRYICEHSLLPLAKFSSGRLHCPCVRQVGHVLFASVSRVHHSTALPFVTRHLYWECVSLVFSGVYVHLRVISFTYFCLSSCWLISCPSAVQSHALRSSVLIYPLFYTLHNGGPFDYIATLLL